jgi:hypothetical protein
LLQALKIGHSLPFVLVNPGSVARRRAGGNYIWDEWFRALRLARAPPQMGYEPGRLAGRCSARVRKRFPFICLRHSIASVGKELFGKRA